MEEDQQEFGGPLSQVYLAAAQRVAAVRLTLEHLYRIPDPPPCSCFLIGKVFEQQHRKRVLVRYWRSLRKEFTEEQIQAAAELEGWDTLRGRPGRREMLDTLLGIDLPTGRPREVFLTERDRDTTARFMDHARREGAEHVEDAFLRQRVLLVNLTGDATEIAQWSTVPLLFTPGGRDAVDVVETAAGLTDGRYEYRRDALTAEFLSALTELSTETLRKPFPSEDEEIDPRPDDLFDPAIFNKLYRILDGDLNLEEQLDTPEGATTPEAVSDRLSDKELQKLATRKGMTREEFLRWLDSI